MSNWVHLNAAATVTWPSGDMSSEDASRTTTQGNALGGQMTAGGKTTIKGVQVGDGQVVGELSIFAYDGTTLMRTYAVPTSSTTNMGVNQSRVEFSFPGGFSASCTGTVDLYVQYEYAPDWTSY